MPTCKIYSHLHPDKYIKPVVGHCSPVTVLPSMTAIEWLTAKSSVYYGDMADIHVFSTLLNICSLGNLFCFFCRCQAMCQLLIVIDWQTTHNHALMHNARSGSWCGRATIENLCSIAVGLPVCHKRGVGKRYQKAHSCWSVPITLCFPLFCFDRTHTQTTTNVFVPQSRNPEIKSHFA